MDKYWSRDAKDISFEQAAAENDPQATLPTQIISFNYRLVEFFFKASM